MTFPEQDRAAIAAADEIEIETHATDGTVHRTIIWIVTSDGDVYVRSVNGPGARWYREATATGEADLHLDGRPIPARVEAAANAAGVAACSEALRAKYTADSSLQSMLMPETLPTTLHVVPA
ncbi:MAG TPA: DUF2255 family protein [Candidatus Limnocylindria bacterium]|nr:DUF2255 family protein [Candidatus Limnocylindria bacterium]